MIEVVSVKFRNKGKKYYFSPNGLTVREGDALVVETSKGLEMADCTQGNHMVEDTAVILPLRPVVRLATVDDERAAEINRGREKEAFGICQEQIKKHGLEMKLVDVECSFEGNKTTFFFTAEDRVDFRELVKDLAGIFRNRIELRQIGVRDEAKMMGGIGICGRPYCCHQFMDEFAPVSTKMAKVQSLSLNPAKISGACGRLMCCLRYEQGAYEDLVKKVPKQGAFVETIDGYGTAVQVNLLRQTVKVKLDSDTDDSLHLYKANELCAVPGGRPKDGEEPPHVLHYVPEEPEEEESPEAESWDLPTLVVPEVKEESLPADRPAREGKSRRRRRRGGEKKGDKSGEKSAPAPEKSPAKERPARGDKAKRATVKPVKLTVKNDGVPQQKAGGESAAAKEKRPARPNRRRSRGKGKGPSA